MSIRSKLQGLGRIANSLLSHPGWSAWVLRTLPESVRGHLFSAQWPSGRDEKNPASSVHPKPMIDEESPLRKYFDSHQTGRGIWKWNHYFDIYHNHFKKFVGREVHIVEVGIYSGGS